MDREMSNPRKVPRKKQRPLSNTVMSEREKKLAVLLKKKRQMDLEIEALQGGRPETESDPGPSTVEESAEEVEDPANRDLALALAERERPAPVAVATIQLPSLEKPKFSAGPRDNPVLFLERFESYYAQVREYRPDKLDEVISCLSREAEDFAFAHRHILTDFPSFREEFLRFFWSKAKRTQLRKELLAEQYDPARGTSMVQFFTRQYGRLKMLFPEQEEEEAIDDLMDALPMAVKDAWTAVPTEGISGGRSSSSPNIRGYVRQNGVADGNHQRSGVAVGNRRRRGAAGLTLGTGKRRWHPLLGRRKGRGRLAHRQKSRCRRLESTLFRFRHRISIRETGDEHARKASMFIQLFKTFKDNLSPHFVCACWV
jgi:hypothetical protein